MKPSSLVIYGLVACTALLSACTFVSQQLADKRMEEQLLKPGALDSPVATNFDEYKFRFLDKYRVSHAWPVTSACKYSSLGTRYKMGDTSYGEIHLVDDIYEDGNSTKQRDDDKPRNIDRFMRSVKVKRPDYKDGKVVGYREAEEGLQAICYEAWVGSNHSISALLFRRTLSEWQDEVAQRQYFRPYIAPDAEQFVQQVEGNRWFVYRSALQPMPVNASGGPFELWILPLGDTGYTLALQFGANQNSLLNPLVHSKFKTMFVHLIESVRFEPLTPAIEAEMNQLRTKANEVSRQDCIRMAQRSKPPAYCQKYLQP